MPDGRMSEPKALANQVEEVVPGVLRWSVHDERIDFLGAAYAVVDGDGTTMIDPLRLSPEALTRLGRVEAIVLTCGSHQRCAWRYRRELGAPVYAPTLSQQIDEPPNERYGDGDLLPGGLRAVFTPGAGTTQHTLLLERDGGVAFVPDLFVLPPGGELTLIPEQYAADMDEVERSVEKVLNLPFSVLCLGHGAAATDDPKAAIRAALQKRREAPADADGWES